MSETRTRETRTREMLKQMQALPLDMKISLTKSRIREWVREFGENGIWKPNKLGLGLGHVFDELNYIYEKQLKSGEIKPFIKYK